MLKKSNQKGFSIIEVLIVLAIAGLIMLIVFLAVPALRRNSANTGRENDASKISAAVQDCLTNHNGLATSCASVGASTVDVTGMSQLNNPTFVAVGAAGTPASLAAGTDTDAAAAVVSYKAKCATDGTGVAIVSTNARDFIVQFNKKSSGGVILQCIGS